jgi:nitrate/nitrite transport system permease protein
VLAIIYVGLVGLLLDRLVAFAGRKLSKGAA